MSKRIALISAGPTWELFDRLADRADYERIVGVNEVPTKIVCTDWAFSDWCSFDKWADGVIALHGSDLPVICTKPISEDRITKTGSEGEHRRYYAALWPRFEHLTHNDLELMAHPKVARRGHRGWWNRYSGPAALMYAWHLARQTGADIIDVFGADMTGTQGIDGRPGSRTPKRWRGERYTWASFCDQIMFDGVLVRHAVDDDGVLVWREPDPLPKEEENPGARFWQYANQHGWVSQRFMCPTEGAFRLFLRGILGEKRAKEVQIREVTK